MRMMAIFVFALLADVKAAVAEVRLICDNPSGEYLVIYSPGAEALILNPDSDRTLYPILVDDKSDRSHVVTAATPDDGPTARLHLRPYVKIEFWSGGSVMQTDGCYAVQGPG